jgi:hypothetical protein
MMAIAVSAVATAIEVGTVAAALSAVATVGTVMTGVGLLTKSKELTKIGGAMALVGGVGGLINGAVSGAAALADAGAAAGDAAAGASDSLVTGASDALSGTAADSSTAGIMNAVQNAGKSGFDLTSPNFGVDSSLMPGASTLPTTGANTLSGAAQAAAPGFGPVAGQNIDDYVAGLGPQGINTPAGVAGDAASTGSSWFDDLKTKMGAQWDSLSPVAKAELMKSAMAIPGAIQAQKNNERALDLQQQRINQTSHGSEVPAFGIIQRAQKGGV